MQAKLSVILLALLLIFTFPPPAFAIVNPLEVPNNRFGIHIIDENDFETASSLVNGNGGQWGYVTFVIREDEQDLARWTRAFNQLALLKLIPIVRLATSNQDGLWQKPSVDQAKPWAIFLDSLPWPTQNRYVILFNEPNHAKEWGGNVNPSEYALIARRYWEQLKRYSSDFFVLPAGLDLAAPNSTATITAANFLDQMFLTDDLIFTLFDGWTSHSYPNPAFCGSPADTGQASIRGFAWETAYLNKYFLPSDTPIFITETGWACQPSQINQYYHEAFTTVWNDSRVVAVTPFILHYQKAPFSAFSWINPATQKPYPHYHAVQSLPKTPGRPILNSYQPNLLVHNNHSL